MAIFRSMARVLACCCALAALAGCASSRSDTSDRTAGQVVDDSVITTRVKTAIFQEPALKVFQINVKTYQGKVQLSGFVDSPQTVQRAGEVVRSVEGVESVQNDLIVK